MIGRLVAVLSSHWSQHRARDLHLRRAARRHQRLLVPGGGAAQAAGRVRRGARAEPAAAQVSTVQYLTVQYSAEQYNTVQHSTVQLLHRLLIPGLVLLFLAPVPWLLQPSSYTCLLRPLAPTLAFSIVLSR